jgi:hypothetical protein
MQIKKIQIKFINKIQKKTFFLNQSKPSTDFFRVANIFSAFKGHYGNYANYDEASILQVS